ncbi:MAG: DUF1871 family protein [Roseburia sp.]|nr:DUF1871 family protein [Roseburia sp.]
MLENITEIINEWDPIGLFPLAPEDEYECEIKKIYDDMHFDLNLTIDILAKKINEVFLQTFDEDVYIENMEQCKLAAKKILKEE